MLGAFAAAIDAFGRHPRPFKLACGVRNYDWGDQEAIPRLLGVENPEARPFAELWIGAHPDLPANALIDEQSVPLDQLIAASPRELLGADVLRRFGAELPFLMKVLAAARPLSIQAHPDRAQAMAGFDRENQAGLPFDAPERSYLDDNHKPELLVALTEFYALRGFRPLDEIADELARIPELAGVAGDYRPERAALVSLYARLLTLDQSAVNAILGPLLDRLAEASRRHPFPRDSHAYWLLEAHRVFSTPERIDRGLLSIPLLNLVVLEPGEGIYLPAGELHAYLEGVGVELMANSNNVLRGGLTHKHIDTDELLRVLTFDAAPAEIVLGEQEHLDPEHRRYPTPASEFSLSRLRLDAGRSWPLVGRPTVVLVTAGRFDLSVSDGLERLGTGDAWFVPSGVGCQLSALSASEVWLASVPRL